jgi:hypothetical protein
MAGALVVLLAGGEGLAREGTKDNESETQSHGEGGRRSVGEKVVGENGGGKKE